jgi:delta24-sterol reductase
MMEQMEKTHSQLVARVAQQVAGYYARKQPFHVYHGSTNSTRILSFKRSEMVDVSQLNRVLSVDTASATAVVEPNVPMDKLVRATLRHGLVPEVVMEFPGITVGGGVQGGAGESSSFRYGCFNQTCTSYEMVLANGSTVTASSQENADLFYGTAGSYGSLGVITAATVRLLPARKYVQLTYIPVASFDEAVAVTKEVTSQDYDYVDGIMFGPEKGVVMAGRLSDEVVGKVVRFSRARDPWFYMHAETMYTPGESGSETVPLVDYLFRYDRGAFWVGRYAFEGFGVPFTPFMRWLLNPMLHTRKLYQALQESGASQLHVVQDLAIPEARAVDFMRYVNETFQVYPLWLCPLKPDKKSPLQSNNLETPLVINVGVWGTQVESYEAFLAANRSIEAKLAELGGKKWFYAHSYYTEEEFWSRYNKAWYDKLRTKYHATTLPTVFDKVSVRKRYDIDRKRGFYRTLFCRAKLRIEN